MAINFPNSPSNGDTHVVGSKTFVYNSTTTSWSVQGNASVDITSITGDILPDADSSRSLGSASKKWKDLYISGDTINLGGIKLRDNNGSLKVETGAGADVSPGGIKVYANLAAFPSSGNTAGDMGFATDTKAVYVWDGTEWDRVYTSPSAVPEWTTEPPTSAALAIDGTATNQTVVASDPEGFPIEYSYDTNPSNQTQATISQSINTFTITPSTTEANAGDFTLRYKATDGLHSTSRSTTYSLSFLPQASALFGRWDIGNSSSYSGSGTTWTDLSGNGRNLTITNGAYNSSGFGSTPVWEWTGEDARIDLPEDLSTVKTFMFIWGFPTGSGRQILINEGPTDFAGYANDSSANTATTIYFGGTHSGQTRSSDMNGNALNSSATSYNTYSYMELNKLNIHTIRGYQANTSTATYANYSSYNHAHQLRAIFMWTTMLTDAEIKEVYDLFPTGSMATWDGA